MRVEDVIIMYVRFFLGHSKRASKPDLLVSLIGDALAGVSNAKGDIDDLG